MDVLFYLINKYRPVESRLIGNDDPVSYWVIFIQPPKSKFYTLCKENNLFYCKPLIENNSSGASRGPKFQIQNRIQKRPKISRLLFGSRP